MVNQCYHLKNIKDRPSLVPMTSVDTYYNMIDEFLTFGSLIGTRCPITYNRHPMKLDKTTMYWYIEYIMEHQKRCNVSNWLEYRCRVKRISYYMRDMPIEYPYKYPFATLLPMMVGIPLTLLLDNEDTTELICESIAYTVYGYAYNRNKNRQKWAINNHGIFWNCRW